MSEPEIKQIQEETKDQEDDATGIWLHLRRSRITSSNFGVVCKRRASTPVANLVKNLLISFIIYKFTFPAMGTRRLCTQVIYSRDAKQRDNCHC